MIFTGELDHNANRGTSTDEVNQSLAERMAAKCGAVICKLLSRESPPDGLFDAVLYNLDDVPPDERPEVLEGLRRRQTSPSHGGPWL